MLKMKLLMYEKSSNNSLIGCLNLIQKRSDSVDSAHQLIGLEDLIQELINMDQLVAKEDSLTELSKHVSITLAKFDSETESLINMLHKRRDNQFPVLLYVHGNYTICITGYRRDIEVDLVPAAGISISLGQGVTNSKPPAQSAKNIKIESITVPVTRLRSSRRKKFSLN
ncbi:hypothetical protein EB796_014571 [Bugula neritina]|uniref:Uncharacterized protein n=1 Tax=Bugula neritina TaxID=10212 RepID=A0A7J7JM18_BUGNE|nr:hypothetical protein EB796_014571 [Bugula neritina]